MIIKMPGIDFELPNFHPTLAIEKLIPKANGDEPLVETLYLSRDVKFGLQAIVDTPVEDDDPFLTREIERLIANSNYQQAYDLYLSDGLDEMPDDFADFLAKHIEL